MLICLSLYIVIILLIRMQEGLRYTLARTNLEIPKSLFGLPINYKAIRFKSRGIKFADFQVLRETTNCCPSLLLELVFLSNGDESSYFQKPKIHQATAIAILESLTVNLDNYERVGN